jgi:DnaJ-domain-containing protein 1
MFRKFSQWFDPAPPQKGAKAPAGQLCGHAGCEEDGTYRAPKSRYHLESGVDDWHWFCLAHIRDYNARWNYYAHMSEDQIEQERRADVTGQRPSWPLGSFSGQEAQQAYLGRSFQDPFDLFKEAATPPASGSQRNISPQSAEGKALAVLGLSYPFSPNDLRKRYRVLVKKHHPDVNGNNPSAEETIKCINDAYRVLKRII